MRILRFKTAAVCLAVFLIAEAVFAPGAAGITIGEEEALSREFLKVVGRRFTFIRDPLINGYVEKVGKRLLDVMPPQPFEYHFYVIKEPIYNAFATPAGHIFINSGLLAAMDRETELAGILAHEIAHVVCRHISQNIDRAPKIGLATLAGIAAGVFLGIGGSAAVGNAVAIGSMAAGQSAALAFSREDEMQADQLALRYLEDAGYSAEGLLSILKKIRGKQWFGSEQVPHYLMTHPASEDRMALIDSWLERHPEEDAENASQNADAFALMQTTLVGKHGDVDQAREYFNSRLAQRPADALAHYGYALALARAGSREKALAHMRAALEKEALNPYILKELGRIYFLDGQYQKAVNALEASIAMSPTDDEGLLFLGQTHLELGQLDKAGNALLSAVEKNPQNGQAYFFLGKVYGKQGRMTEAHYYLGVYYQEKGELQNALFHLSRAAEGSHDALRSEAIDRRLTALKTELERRRKAARP